MTRHVGPRNLASTSADRGAPRASDAELQTRIGRSYRFESAHHLPRVPQGHRCRNLHGHNYRVEVVLRGKPDARGFVKDFAEVDALVLPLVAELDHRLLNDVPGLENPTAEVIAAWFLDRIPSCERVRVYENDDCWAEVSVAASLPHEP
jgi:6-pyruvoyltetrahydropterin/6-carboxytetrahydropterin synthase